MSVCKLMLQDADSRRLTLCDVHINLIFQYFAVFL